MALVGLRGLYMNAGNATSAFTMSDTKWHVYLLRCADETLYCGITTDMNRRLRQHNEGSASKYTRARLPVELAACVPVADKSSALKLELAVKKRPRGDKMAWLLKQRQTAT